MNLVYNAGTQGIETDRLYLRPFVEQDAEDMLELWINDKEVQFNYGEPVYDSMESVKEILQRWITSYSKSEFYRWAIILKENKHNIGQIAFCGLDLNHHFADLEYCISRKYQGKGYATEALNSVIQFTFEHTAINRLQAFHRGSNIASGKVLEKSHMLFEGILRGSYYYSDINEYDDKAYYGITRKNFLEKLNI
ncbi:putative ribosomal N-acetyltransferase YdaF [compost metagenome]